ncbi:MAG: hypothetical protein H7096_00285 [Flavobacterium sp.]|nr:hypothetical protein [Pedobacter sp.]
MAKKAKTKKLANKANSRASKKELESSITDKFMEVITNLGHDAGKLGKDIKRTSKQLAKKISDKLKDVKQTVGDKLENNNKTKTKNLKKRLTTAKLASSSANKAEMVVSKITTVKPDLKPAKRAYVRRVAKPDTNLTSGLLKTTNAKKPGSSRVSTGKPAVKRPVTRKVSPSAEIKNENSEVKTDVKDAGESSGQE